MHDDLLIAYDLGTGGIKASLFGLDGVPLENTFFQYDVSYPGNGFQEQRPELWVEGMVSATKRLLGRSNVDPARVAAPSNSAPPAMVISTSIRWSTASR